MRTHHFFICLTLAFFFTGCAGYKQNIMFRVPDGMNITEQVEAAESNYTIQKNDFLQLDVFTNGGEKIIDPNLESFKSTGAQIQPDEKLYLVDLAGEVKFPLIPKIKLEGLTIGQAEALLQKEYEKFYQDPFVLLKFSNKRVIVLGAPGGQVIPLVNENMRLTEILALAKGLNNDAKANNIRILRDDQVLVSDLSTIEGYRKQNYIMHSGDIVYVEPVRRPFSEGIREYGPLISIIASIGTLIVVIMQTTNSGAN